LRRNLILALILATLTGVAPILAQEEQLAEEMPVFLENVDVQIINVDVVVTDKKGNTIRDLTIDDFVVLENRQVQLLTNFYEIREQSGKTVTIAPASDPGQAPIVEELDEVPPHLQRRVVFFIDNLSLGVFSRNRVFRDMMQFAEDVLRPGDQAMIATWNRSLKIRVPWTNNHEQIKRELETISGESALGISYQSERRQIQSRIREADDRNDAIVQARSWAQSIEHDLRQTVSSINALMSTLSGIEGKKIMVLTSEGFQMQPGAEMFSFIDHVSRTKAEWGSQSGGTLLEGMAFNSAHLIQSVAREANASDITLYAIHAAGLTGLGSSSAENFDTVPLEVEMVGLHNSTDSLRLMAEMTGGVAVTGSNNFKLAFDQIERDLGGYYSLGYRSGTQRVDRQRSIEVQLKDPSLRRQYSVRARSSFVEKSIGSEMNDKVIANLFHESAGNDIGVFLTTGRPVRHDDGTFLVSLDIHIPMDSLTFLPAGGSQRGSFTVWIVAADIRGDMSDMQSQQHTFSIPDDELAALKGKHYTYTFDLILRKGRNTLSVGALDDVSRLRGFAQTDILAADLR